MRLVDIERKARQLGIKNTWKLSKKELVKAIQRAEGNFDCFGTITAYCDQLSCCWRIECLRK
ncbi:MAG: hypothetical protein ABSB18_07540 [Candidatus Omnitrophota bacterium]